MTLKTVRRKDRYVPEETKKFKEKIRGGIPVGYPGCHGNNPDPDRNCPPLSEINHWLTENKINSKKPPVHLMPANWECRTCIYLDDS